MGQFSNFYSKMVKWILSTRNWNAELNYDNYDTWDSIVILESIEIRSWELDLERDRERKEIDKREGTRGRSMKISQVHCIVAMICLELYMMSCQA